MTQPIRNHMSALYFFAGIFVGQLASGLLFLILWRADMNVMKLFSLHKAISTPPKTEEPPPPPPPPKEANPILALLDYPFNDTSSSALWFVAAVIQLVANILLTQKEYAANYTVQLIANTFWMIAAIAHGIALRAIATGLMLCVNILLLCGSGLFLASGFVPQPPNSNVLFYYLVVATVCYGCAATTVSRISPIRKVRIGAVGFVFGASGTCINALCSLYYPAAPFATLRPIAAATCLVLGGFTWTTVVAERDLDKPDYLPLS